MVVSQKITDTWKALTQAWKKQDLNQVGKLLDVAKLELLQTNFLPNSGQDSQKDELLIARDVLEIGAQYSVLKRDIPAFERYYAQLRCYYFDYSLLLSPSAFKHIIIGLNLLCLLAQNRLADFHMEIELIPANELFENAYIRHPFTLEQWLMEGSYSKVFSSKQSVPDELYNYFMDILLDTVRVEIADCIEKAYDTIGFQDATEMFNCPDSKQLQQFIKQRNWVVDSTGKRFLFSKKEADHIKQEARQTIPAEKLASEVLEYARELEKIV